MKRFTDIFIKRPVLASALSLMILLVGLGGILKLPLQEYPSMENTVITITTSYPGASSGVVQGFITTPLEQSIGSAEGIDYMTSQSTLGASTITVYAKLNYDPNIALTQITGKVSAVLSQLPQGTQTPVIQETNSTGPPDLIIGLTSPTMNLEQVTAYATNVLTAKINSLGGISSVYIFGAKDYAMRIWLNTYKMAKLGITPSQVFTALQNNNVVATAGQMKSQYIYTDINATTDLHTAAQFDQLVISNANGHLIRIQDIGQAELGPVNYDSAVYHDGKPAVFAAVRVASDANPLTVVSNVIKAMPTFAKAFPSGLHYDVVFDSTTFIKASIKDVIKTIIGATLIVMLVIFLFLGTFRSMLIPVIAIPLSLVGVCFLMLIMGFSLNLLTLLAMVLAIGLVVDDAIVVLENIYRYLEAGMKPVDAALKGAREIANPVIVMTTTLAAVFAPIGFLGGVTGALFREFAFTLAAAVIVSGVIALTFSPMLCSKVINQKTMHNRLVEKIDRFFAAIKGRYQRALGHVLPYRSLVVSIGGVILISCAFLFMGTKKELAPTEDQGVLFISGTAPTPVNLNYMQRFNQQFLDILNSFPEMENTFLVDDFQSPNTMFGGMILKPWDERKRTQMQLNTILQNKFSQITGIQTHAFQPPPLPQNSFGLPVQFVISSTASYSVLYGYEQQFIAKIMKSGLFMFAQGDLRFDQPQLDITVDRDKAASMNIPMSNINTTLSTMLSDNFVNYFNQYGYAYDVIPQVYDSLRQVQQQLQTIYLNTQNTTGTPIPLSTFVTMKPDVQPSSLNRFQQLNSVTISASPMPGVSTGEALTYLHNTASNMFPSTTTYDYAGQSRQYIQEGNSLIFAFIFAILVIYLVLCMQFESFRDPFIILVAVPMSIFGALIPIYLGASTMNIYTEIGLITLIGLISKHGILMVEFANKLQEAGTPKLEAIIEAAATRLRPILMTTFAMVLGVVPLLIATGAGAVSRFDIGLTIAAGMTIGTCFTLFVVPTIYIFLAKDRQHGKSPTRDQ